jgi:xylulokinase
MPHISEAGHKVSSAGLVAGVDCSTQSTKVLLVDACSGEVVDKTSWPNHVEGEGGARESDPAGWAQALVNALAATQRCRDITAISVGAQQHGLVVLDEAGKPVAPAPLWHDTRAAGDARRLVEALGGAAACAAETGSVLTGSFTACHWARWKRERPELVARADKVMLPHDYLTFCLTGRHTTDRSDVSGTGWWSPRTEAYNKRLLAMPEMDLDPDLLPEVIAPDGVAGQVNSKSAARFGLTPGIPVACGAGDNAAAALALGLVPGEAALSLGTSGTVFAPARLPSADASGTVAGFAGADGGWLPLACTLNATLAVDEVASWLGLGREDVAPAGDIVFLPWFGGERTPDLPLATGAVSGLRYGTEPRAILQAAYDGLVATLLVALEQLAQWAPQRLDTPLVLVGGGARGKAWQETVRRLSGRPVVVPDATELVAYGAAVQAAAVLSKLHPGEVARSWGGRRGDVLPALERDTATVERVTAWRRHMKSWHER